MTNTKQLKWRLKEQPSTESLRELVKDGILTKDEAREILFSLETEEDRDKKSLESEIKFLRELVEKLSKNDNHRIVEIIREVESPWRRYPWYNPYITWSTETLATCTNTSSSTNATTGISSGGGTFIVNTMPLSSFSNIKTF